MKKIALIVSVACFAAFSFTSCKKCSTCSVKDSGGAVVYTAPEVCGKKSEIDTYEQNVKSVWGQGGNTVTCASK